MRIPLVIIGGGLSGIAAAIRFARFSPEVLLLEKHSRAGGLNSYYYRNKRLFETGLHAITNYASPKDKHAPLNKLFRQLKISRKSLHFHQQHKSEILFQHKHSLSFTNDFNFFNDEIEKKFPLCHDGFVTLCKEIDYFDPFQIQPYKSARQFIRSHIHDDLLVDMLLCPLMYYGSSVENDMDLSQFVIMFRSIFQEGMFRPSGSMKDFLELLLQHYKGLGGEVKLNTAVKKIIHEKNKIIGVELDNEEIIHCDHIISTIGLDETKRLLNEKQMQPSGNRLGFVESIFIVKSSANSQLPTDKTIIFFNNGKNFHYQKPDEKVEVSSGVICFPGNFQGLVPKDSIEIRSTHLANYHEWLRYRDDSSLYKDEKHKVALTSQHVLEQIVGDFHQDIIYEDTFTPLTIEKFTSKCEGAIYGSPTKTKDGDIGFSNLFLAGTDQGFLGIIGSMLSGVSMVNQHVLPKI